jgi:hypothetical protein
MDAADRVISYLYGTRTLAIEYSPDGVSSEFSSDAAFADNVDRKSSEGYLFKLFGGAVDWRAAKQKTVTTSTTEAELLALSNAARETLWWTRFVRKFIRKVSYDYLQRSSLEERREKGFLGDIMGYLYPFSLGDPLISHLEISGHSFILFPSGSSISFLLFRIFHHCQGTSFSSLTVNYAWRSL